MSDEPKLDLPSDGWVMPEPVYRSTPGRSPGEIHQTENTGDDTTQPGFIDQDNIDTLAPDFVEAEETPAAAPVKVTPATPKPKKSGCARSFFTVVSVIVLAAIGIVIALIYFLFYYKSADTSTF
jgi:hypothetical protein